MNLNVIRIKFLGEKKRILTQFYTLEEERRHNLSNIKPIKSSVSITTGKDKYPTTQLTKIYLTPVSWINQQ